MALNLTDSSRFNGELTPFFPKHGRRVPTQDYLGQIAVRVVSIAAGGTDEARLVLATPAVYRATHGAYARDVVGGHFQKRSPGSSNVLCIPTYPITAR